LKECWTIRAGNTPSTSPTTRSSSENGAKPPGRNSGFSPSNPPLSTPSPARPHKTKKLAFSGQACQEVEGGPMFHCMFCDISTNNVLWIDGVQVQVNCCGRKDCVKARIE
jgi:hypothetical protein